MSVYINRDQIRDFAQRSARAVDQAVKMTALETLGNIRENAPIDHGRLAGSFNIKKTGALRYMIYTNVHYARFQNDGTGIYGPRKRPITPKKKNGVLVFRIKGNTIFARSVRGVKGRKYIEKSILQAEARRRDFVDQALKKVGLVE